MPFGGEKKAMVPHAVGVDFSGGAEARMEARGCFTDCEDAGRRGQARI